MRFGVIGDIHAEDELLVLALQYLTAQGVDQILSVGDIVDGPGDVNRAVDLLVESDVQAVKGNHDRWLISDSYRHLRDTHTLNDLTASSQNYLRQLPVTREFKTSHGLLLLCHGLGDDDMEGINPDTPDYAIVHHHMLQPMLRDARYRFVVNGHTHRRMVRHFGRLTIINAGTLFRGHSPCVAILDFEELTTMFFEPSGDTFVLAEEMSLMNKGSSNQPKIKD